MELTRLNHNLPGHCWMELAEDLYWGWVLNSLHDCEWDLYLGLFMRSDLQVGSAEEACYRPDD